VAKLAAGVVDTGGEPPPDDTVLHLELQISLRICEKFEVTLMVYQDAVVKLIHEKTWSQKSCGTVPLMKIIPPETL
jgi:hypothetical protein